MTFDLREGKITNYDTNIEKASTEIKEYIVSDDELRVLYSFFTLEAIEKFEAMSESEYVNMRQGTMTVRICDIC